MAEDPFRYFRIEADELLSEIGQDALGIERGDVEAPVRILRRAHTLKGAAGVVGLQEVVALAHALEERLEPWRDGTVPAPAEVVDEVLDLVDRLRAGVPPPEGESQGFPSDAEEATGAEDTDDTRLRRGPGWVRVEGQALSELTEALDGARQALFALSDVMDGAAPLGPLVALERELRLASHAADRLRHVSLDDLQVELERAVRDAARAEGKQVRLVFEASRERVEPEVLSILREVLLHLVSNAVAHGLEPPEVRRAAGKRPEGRIDVRVARRGPQLFLEVEDDGAGFDREALREAARAAGRLVEGDDVAPETLEALAFEPGVSSRRAVDHRAGRGMGLEAVRTRLHRAGGTVRWSSRPGRGVRLTCALPASRTRVPVLVVRTGRRECALPLHAVEAVVREEEIERVGGTGAERVRVGGEVRAAGSLAMVLGEPPRREGILVQVGGGEAQAGLWVEAVTDTREAVVEPLPRAYRGHPMFLGCYLDGGPAPRLVLDPLPLVDRIQSGRAEPTVRAARPRPRILVVDDSVTSRMLEKSILESDGWEVDLAASGKEALKLLATQPYGLALVDVEMPGMSGLELVQRVRSDPDLVDLPMIVVSSLASEADLARGRAAGADDWVDKNRFEQGYLLERIRELIG